MSGIDVINVSRIHVDYVCDGFTRQTASPPPRGPPEETGGERSGWADGGGGGD